MNMYMYMFVAMVSLAEECCEVMHKVKWLWEWLSDMRVKSAKGIVELSLSF